MKIEYGRAWDWAKSLVLQVKVVHHDKWMADGYGYLSDIIKEHYAPQVTAEIFGKDGDSIRVPLAKQLGEECEAYLIPLARHKFIDKVGEDWKEDESPENT